MSGHIHTHIHTVCGKKPLLLPFNETERAVQDPFEVRAYLPSVLNPF